MGLSDARSGQEFQICVPGSTSRAVLIFFSSLFILSAQQDSMKKANMKRENKAYSFKEQIIELELKEVS